MAPALTGSQWNCSRPDRRQAQCPIPSPALNAALEGRYLVLKPELALPRVLQVIREIDGSHPKSTTDVTNP
jgi:hypothetical protein